MRRKRRRIAACIVRFDRLARPPMAARAVARIVPERARSAGAAATGGSVTA
jgi:hypothetical protein